MLVRYLAILLETYFAYREIGQIRQGPFVMRYQFEDDGTTRRRDREPDIQVILNTNPNTLTPTFMDGAADIVIEVVSPESVQRDYGEKLHEYERAGVPEYWIIDPIQSKARFYHLNAEQAYVLQEVGENYETTRLTGLKLHIPTLWKANLPKPPATVKSVQEMLDI
jgi:Uma2 family endonuclease